MPAKRSRYIAMGGGLDVTSSAINIPPGRLLSCFNFEPDFHGGYRIVRGYERYDGNQRPSREGFWAFDARPVFPDFSGGKKHTVDGVTYDDEAAWFASYEALAERFDETLPYPRGEVVTRLARIRDNAGADVGFGRVCGFAGDVPPTGERRSITLSDGTVKIVYEDRYRIGLFGVSGSLGIGDVVNHRFVVTSKPAFQDAGIAPLVGGEDERDAWKDTVRWAHVARNAVRKFITSVPGSDEIRGLWCVGAGANEKTYAFRDNQAGTRCVGYQATRSRFNEGIATFTYSVGTANPPAANGAMRMLWSGEVSAGENPINEQQYLEARTLYLFHADKQGDTIDTFMGRTHVGNVIRFREIAEDGNQLETEVVGDPFKTGNVWRIEVKYVRHRGPLDAGSKEWMVDVEFGSSDDVGWQPIAADRFLKWIRFDNGQSIDGSGASPWREGTKIETGVGFAATIHRVVDWAGGYATQDARGYLVLRDVSGTVPVDNINLIVRDKSNVQKKAAEARATTGAAVLNDTTIDAGATIRFVNNNFLGTAGTERGYGCVGETLFEIDEKGYFSQIVIPTLRDISGVEDDPDTRNFGDFVIPQEHRDHLFVATEGGRLFMSRNADPMNFSAILGAAEFGVGSDIVGLESVTGGVLVIANEKGVKALYGAAPQLELRDVSEKEGFRLNSVRKIDDVYGLSWAGIGGMTRTDQFGDFNSDTVSTAVDPILKNLLPRFVCSSLVRGDNLYRAHYRERVRWGSVGRYEIASAVAQPKDTDTVLTAVIGSSGTARTLTIPLTPATSHLETAGGGAFHSTRRTSQATDALVDNAVKFHVDSDTLTIGYNPVNAIFFTRADAFWDGMEVLVESTANVAAGTFIVSSETFDATKNIATFTGVYTPVAESGSRVSDGTDYDLFFSFNKDSLRRRGELPLDRVVLRTRSDEEHIYTIERYQPEGTVADPTVILTMAESASDDFLSTVSTPFAFELLVKGDDSNAETEVMSMYVPDKTDRADEIGATTIERVQFGRSVMPINLSYVWECRTGGEDRILFAAHDGLAYEDRSGSTFDGRLIEGFVRTPYIYIDSPLSRKRVHAVSLELASEYPVTTNISADFDFSTPGKGTSVATLESFQGRGGLWDAEYNWDEFNWDGSDLTSIDTGLTGVGTTLSLVMGFSGVTLTNLNLQGFLVQYTPRRAKNI